MKIYIIILNLLFIYSLLINKLNIKKMKKLSLLLVMVTFFGFAQEKKMNVYADASVSTGVNVGVALELYNKKSIFGGKESSTFKILYTRSTLETIPTFQFGVLDIKGSGFNIETKTNYYFNKTEHKGFYLSSGFGYTSINFEEKKLDFDGTYKFLYFPVEAGFKFNLAKNIPVLIFAGMDIKIELDDKGDVNNDSFDNITPRLGVAVGYNF